ncbi:hypothetical protein ENSA5_36730 [Enhygromyxa salina]|uniref:FixH n=1 Tax=Enhygromyxa salina TaxID=215803 RepID=A0A2S9XUP5_9BACT|nr:FixH family protein [Enhygromyxa salina]PRP96597.1 hypothetical protein ENSA5_36730 [Enhygromyxa salina]
MSKAWPIGVVVGLGVVVVANAIMISIAVSNPSAPAAADHWTESLEWDQELDLRERSAALGWSVAQLGRSPDGGSLGVDLIDAEGRALTGLSGTLTLERSDSAAHDRALALHEAPGGRYLTAGEIPARGLYEVTIDVHTAAGERFVTRQRAELRTLPALARPSAGGEP